MGEEEKKVEEKKIEGKKVEEKPKKVEEGEKKVEAKDEKKEKSNEEAKAEDAPKEPPPPPPPPPPQEIVLRVYMHCEGCARKIRKSLKGFQGVEDVMTDCKTHKVVVKGEKADPFKVLARVQRKSHRHVELLSPIPAEPKKPEQKEAPKPPEKKVEPQVITVVLKVHMHCEACAQVIKKRIQRMKGVEIVDTDLKGSQVTVKGVVDPANLVEYVYKKTGKHAVVIKQGPEKKKEEIKGNEATEKKKGDEGGDKEGKKTEDPAPAVPSEAGKEKKEKGGEKEAAKPEEVPVPATGEKEPKNEVMEMIKKNEFYYYFPPQNYEIHPPRGVTEVYPPAPQMFSDENPNACSVM